MGRVRSRLRPLLALLVLAGVTLAGCAGGDDASEASETTAPAASSGASAHAGPRLAAVRRGLGDALFVTAAPGQANRLYVVQQSGRILILQNGRLLKAPFLDVSSLISSGGEQGLLGLAFHPRYASNGRFYVNYTNRAGDTRVVEYRRASRQPRQPPAAPGGCWRSTSPSPTTTAGTSPSARTGACTSGTGDGGSGGDPQGNGQRVDTLLGKILRIDVDTRTGSLPYGIPADNPYASGGGRREIYSYGLRNPWRFSFDRANGDIWIGDVGQNEVEEIDHRPEGGARGANFGWNAYEGTRPFGGARRGSEPVPPVAEYSHDQGCSVTGGYVSRGTRAPSLAGRYVYADFCSGRVWSMRAGANPGDVREETGRLGRSVSNVTSFGEGLGGDLYLLAGGTLYRFSG